MKVVLDDIEIMVKDIKYGQKLELLGHYQDVLKPVHEKTGEISQRQFNTLLSHVSEIAFLNAEDDLKKYDYSVQINLLTKILLDYLDLSVESKKENGD
jgi:hypothetical protein|tara:strand:- start:1441 stop:1734 length:294 start_codon:yes stop_codon:yes gene_type:complete